MLSIFEYFCLILGMWIMLVCIHFIITVQKLRLRDAGPFFMLGAHELGARCSKTIFIKIIRVNTKKSYISFHSYY